MQLVAYTIAHTAFVLNSIIVNQLAIIYSLIAPCNHITRTDSSVLLDCLSTQYCQIQDHGTITTLCTWELLCYNRIRLITFPYFTPFIWQLRCTNRSIDYSRNLRTNGQVKCNDNTIATCNLTYQRICIYT